MVGFTLFIYLIITWHRQFLFFLKIQLPYKQYTPCGEGDFTNRHREYSDSGQQVVDHTVLFLVGFKRITLDT